MTTALAILALTAAIETAIYWWGLSRCRSPGSNASVSVWRKRGIPVIRQVEIQHKTWGRLKAELPKFKP